MALTALGCPRPTIAPPPVEDSEPPVDTQDSEPPAPDGDTAVEQVGDLVFEHLPVLVVDTDGQEIEGEDKIDAWLAEVRDHDGTLEDLAEAGRGWDGPIGIELHGTSSSSYDKTGYRFETRNEVGSDRDYPLLGLPAESDWVLHGPYSDKTLLRNALAYTVAARVAEDRERYEPRIAFCELVLNDDYRGVYLLVERVKRSDLRLDIPDPAPTTEAGDLSGAYLLKVDYTRNEHWETSAGSLIGWVDPGAEEITADQDAYLRAWFEDLEATLQAEGWADPETGYPAWIDTDSFIDHFIVNELAKNIDAYRLSAYLHKAADADGGRLHAGPVWDFDRAWGNVNYCDCQYTHGWIIDGLTDAGYGYQYPFWWPQLLTDPGFQDPLRCRWEALRLDVLSDEALLGTIDTLAAEVAAVQPREDERWDTIGTHIEPNWYVGETWDEELDYLRDWLMERTAWLDAELPGTCG